MIGNYIHYHKYNYKKWGTNQVRTSPSENWNSVINKIKRDIDKSNEIQSLIAESKKIEDNYNNLFYLNYSKANRNGVKFRKSLEQAIQNSLNSQYGFAAGKFNPDTMAVEETVLQKQLTEAVKKTRERIGVIEKRKTATAQQLLNISNKLILLINQKDFESIEGIKGRIEKVNYHLEYIKRKLMSSMKFKNPNFLISNVNDIRSINSIIQEFNRIPSLYDQNQKLFEWILPFVGLKLDYLSKDELKKEMEKISNQFNKTNNNVKMNLQFDSDFTLKKVTDIDIAFDNIKIKSESDFYSSKIYIGYTDKSNRLVYNRPKLEEFKGKDISMFFDNYSLYRILEQANEYNFSNHYLNIITYADKQRSSSEEVLEANRLLKGYISSLNSNRVMNNFLVINDKKNNRVNSYSLKALMYILQNHVVQPKSRYSDVINISNSYRTSNKWEEESKEERIRKIIFRLQKKKVSAKLRGEDINNYLYMLKSYKT